MLRITSGSRCKEDGSYSLDAIDNAVIHEVSRYCMRCWTYSNVHSAHWADCTQEVLMRLLKNLQPDQWSGDLFDAASSSFARKEFLRAIHAVKRRTTRARKYISGTLPELTELAVSTQRDEAREALLELLSAQNVLSKRQLQILLLTADGHSPSDIAEQLHTRTERVHDEKYKSLQRMREIFGRAAF